jgi:hypothetical protein
VLDAVLRAIAARDLVAGDAVVEAVLRVADVREAVPLRRGLRVEVVDDVVAAGALAGDRVTEVAAAEQRRIRLLELPVQRERPAAPYQSRRLHRLRRGHEVHAADLVVGAEQAPR